MGISRNISGWLKSHQQGFLHKNVNLSKFHRFDRGESSFGPSKKTINVLKSLTYSDLNNRPDTNIPRLKNIIARQLNVTRDMITITNGSDDLIKAIPMVFLNRGDACITVEPTFYIFADVSLRVGVKLHSVLLNEKNGFILTAETSEQVVKLAKKVNAKLIWLCNPNNPTGVYIEPKLIEFIAKSCNAYVIVDEAFIEFVAEDNGASAVRLIKRHKNILVTRTLSKVFGLCGIRLGYGIGSSDIIRIFEALKMPFAISTIHQKIAETILLDRVYLEYVIKKTAIERRFVEKEVSQMNHIKIGSSSKTNFLFLKHRSKNLYKELYLRNILTADFNRCKGIDSNGYVRATISDTRKENKIFINALKSI